MIKNALSADQKIAELFFNQLYIKSVKLIMFIWKPTYKFLNSKYSQGWLPDEHNQLDRLYITCDEIIKNNTLDTGSMSQSVLPISAMFSW